MDESKKPLMIGVVVVCFIVAGFILYKTHSGSGVTTIKPGEKMLWVKCSNTACNNEYEMDEVDYIKHLRDFRSGGDAAAPMVCPKCGQKSVFEAIKCPKCGNVFFAGNPGDLPDRCPKCKFSQIEESRKQALLQQQQQK